MINELGVRIRIRASKLRKLHGFIVSLNGWRELSTLPLLSILDPTDMGRLGSE